MKLSKICLSASIVAVAIGQRRPNRKKNKNKNRKPTKPALIEVPTQERFLKYEKKTKYVLKIA